MNEKQTWSQFEKLVAELGQMVKAEDKKVAQRNRHLQAVHNLWKQNKFIRDRLRKADGKKDLGLWEYLLVLFPTLDRGYGDRVVRALRVLDRITFLLMDDTENILKCFQLDDADRHAVLDVAERSGNNLADLDKLDDIAQVDTFVQALALDKPNLSQEESQQVRFVYLETGEVDLSGIALRPIAKILQKAHSRLSMAAHANPEKLRALPDAEQFKLAAAELQPRLESVVAKL